MSCHVSIFRSFSATRGSPRLIRPSVGRSRSVLKIESRGETPGAFYGGARDARSPLRGLTASPRPDTTTTKAGGPWARARVASWAFDTPRPSLRGLGRGPVGLGVKATRLDALGHRFESRVASLGAPWPQPPYKGGLRPPLRPITTNTKGTLRPSALHTQYKGGTRVGVPLLYPTKGENPRKGLPAHHYKGGIPYRGSLTTNTKGKRTFSPLGRLPWGLIRSPGRPPA